MKLRSVLLMLLIYSFSSEVSAFEIVNSGADFRDFLSNWERSQGEQKIYDWTTFEEKYADIFEHVVFDHASATWPTTKSDALSEFFAALPNIKDKMLSHFDQAQSTAQKSVAAIRKVLPDFTDNLTFIFIPTALRFNAMENYIKGRRGEVVIVGVDAVVKWESNLDVLLTHELFHKHHFEKIFIRSAFTSIASALWTEGLATYASELANPGVSKAEIFYDKGLAEECEKPQYVAGLAKKYLEIYRRPMIDKERLELRREWFWLNENVKPSRPGYCLGYQAAKNLAKDNSLEEMISWGEMTYEDKVELALKKLLHP